MNTTHRFCGRHRQGGQAVIWFLAMIAACCCTFALVYNVGQLTNKKEETINAADATALSGALVQARTLNFEAYTNRAIIANEVAIAQVISLDSWLQYDNQIIQWLKNYSQPIPILNSAMGGIATASEQAANIGDTAFGVAVKGADGLNALLGLARDGANTLGFIAANDVAGNIAGANATTFDGVYDEHPTLDGGFKAVVFLTNESNWNGFTDPFSNDDRKYTKDVVTNSRDQFSAHRGEGKALDLVNGFLALAGHLAGNVTYFGWAKTSGSTELQSLDSMAAQDSLDSTISFNPCVALLPCPFITKVIPFGPAWAYGRVDANDNGDTGSNLCSDTTTNCELAMNDGNKNIDWNGLRSIRDLKKGMQPDPLCSTENGSDSASLSFVSAVEKSGKATLSTGRMGIGTSGTDSVPQMNDDLANGDNFTSIAAACTFFLRPDANSKDSSLGNLARSDGVHEYASLYNPYWQSRLAKADSNLVTTLYAMIGQPGLNLITN